MSENWTTDWDEDQQKFIEKLSKTDGAFNDIFAKDPDGMVIGYEESQELKELQKKNKKILDKLQKQEFDVAIVGLEKAGKSTLGNALIKSNKLPEYTERCTYTTTEIRYGEEDMAEIEFYSREEFQKNFSDMLKTIEYEANPDFFTLDKGVFERFWNAKENSDEKLFNAYNDTIAADIKTMLAGKNIIKELLGSEKRKFKSNPEEFNLYVTGIGGKENGVVKRTAHPYAVSHVLVTSPELKEMEQTVLFDVPGFDSPTQLHKTLTERMLKEADAIILVTNAKDPSLRGTALSMLRKNRDEDDVKLNEKVFIFGNQIDLVKNKEVAIDNEAVIKSNAENNRVAERKRVVVGSAKAYLEKNKIFTKDDLERGLTGADKTLEEWGLDDGVKDLRTRMKDYYKNERYEILKRRAEKTLERTEKYLGEILEKYSPENLSMLGDGSQETIDAVFALDDFVKEANNILVKHREKILTEKPFSRMIEENIAEIFPEIDEEQEQLKSIELKGNVYESNNYPVTRVDSELREVLDTDFRRKIVEYSAKKTLEEQERLNEELVEKFLNILGMEENCSRKEELKANVNKLFDEMIVENGEECRFNSLVERFTSSLIHSLIQHPFGKPERYNHMTAESEIPEFISLAAYYKEDGTRKFTAGEKKQRDLFAKILAHEGANTANANALSDASGMEVENLNALSKFFSDNKELIDNGVSLAIELLPMGKWAKILAKAGVKLGSMDILPKWAKKLNEAETKKVWRSYDQKKKEEHFAKLIQSVCDKQTRLNPGANSPVSEANNDNAQILTEEFLEEMNNLAKTRGISTKENMLETLNTDINILRDITLRAVIAAIGLERAYNSVVGKNVELIRKALKPEQEAEKKRIKIWLSKNIRLIKESEFAAREIELANNQTRKMIVETLRGVLKTIENL